MPNVTDINTAKDRRIDRAIRQFQTARKIYDLQKLQRALIERPETFTAHIHRLRLPLPSKV